MTHTIHPLADEWSDGYMLMTSASERVTLTAGLRAFLLDARESMLYPVLMTSSTAHLGWFVADELRLAGGYWAVRVPGSGVFDGRTGRRIHVISDLWAPQPHSDPGLMSFDSPTVQARGGLFLDVFTREQAEDRTQAFGPAEHLLSALVGDRLVRWDTAEPLARRWSRADATRALRLQMPASERLFARSIGGAAVSVTMARTASGLLEHTRILLPTGMYDQPFGVPKAQLAGHPRLTKALTGLAERFRVNVAMASYCEVAERTGSVGQLAEQRRADAPVAVVIGPVASRSLNIDIGDLAQRHDVVKVGLSRAPSVLVRFSSPDPLWNQFIDFGRDLDQQRLASMLTQEFLDSQPGGGVG